MVCVATRSGFALLAEEMRPFPSTHSLPSWFPLRKAATRAPYEGEPRDAMPLLANPEPQYWAHRWVDTVVELWAGPIYIEGGLRLAQRDAVLMTILTLWTSSMRRRVWESVAHDGDLRAARDYLDLAGVINGPLPQLIDEVEGRV